MADLNYKLKEDTTGAFFTILFLLLLTIPSALWTGFVLHKLYNWFVLTIPGAPILNIGQMLGISLIVNLMLCNVQKQTDNTVEKAESWVSVFSTAFAKMLFVPAIFLFFGWLYQLAFMR